MPRHRKGRDDSEDEEETAPLMESPLSPHPPGSAGSSSSSSNSSSAGIVNGDSGTQPTSPHVSGALVIPVMTPDVKTGALPTARSVSSTGYMSADGGKDISICRICLEEESCGNLDTPCACSGTQRHAHEACIQRWIEEKGHLRCEICGQQYKGNYTAPPPRPEPEATMLPVLIVDPENPTRITIRHSRETQMLDESLDNEYQRHPGLNFIFTTCVFILFLVVLHHTVGITDDADDGTAAPSPPPPTMPDDSDPTDGFTFFLFWILTKVLLIGIPLWTILRVAQRQAQNQQYEEMVRGAMDGNRRIVLRVHTVRGSGSEMVTTTGVHAV